MTLKHVKKNKSCYHFFKDKFTFMRYHKNNFKDGFNKLTWKYLKQYLESKFFVYELLVYLIKNFETHFSQ